MSQTVSEPIDATPVLHGASSPAGDQRQYTYTQTYRAQQGVRINRGALVVTLDDAPQDTAIHQFGPTDSVAKAMRSTVSAVSNKFSHLDIAQLDGPQDYHPPMIASSSRALIAPSHVKVHSTPYQRARTAYHDLLPYCTVEMPLGEQELVGLSDVAGSLKEVMLLALRAKKNDQCKRRLEKAVGADAMRGIVDFFADEFEV